MNSNIKTRWIAALRSGKYPQTAGRLNRLKPGHSALFGTTVPPGLCCLGVLCELAVEDGVVERRYYGNNYASVDSLEEADGIEYKAGAGDAGSSVLPVAVQAWAGLESVCGGGITLPSGDRRDLTHANDVARMSFPEIADIIEAQL
jgi:hypothetical protein